MVAMVDVSLRHSGLLGSSDHQPCFHSIERSHPSPPSCRWGDAACPIHLPPGSQSRPGGRWIGHPSPSCRWENAAGPLLLPPFAKSRLWRRLSRQEVKCRRIRGSKDAGVYEFSLRVRRAGFHSVAAEAKVSGIRPSQFKTRAVKNEEFERGGVAGDGILIKYRTAGEEEGNAGQDGGSKAGGGGESDAKTATAAVKVSTEEFVEKFEDTLGVDRKRSHPGNSELPKDGLTGLQDERFLRWVAVAENADAALALIAERGSGKGGCVSNEDCSRLILAAIEQNNVDLAFSILNSMRSRLRQRRIGQEEDTSGERGRNLGWSWPQPDVATYVALVRGLAASLRVSDAIQTVADVRRRGVPQGDEVPFGKIVNCPTCKTSLAVVQLQHGIQMVPCATCRYKYELMSGAVVSSESESISSKASIWERGLKVLPFLNRRIPAAVHSVVVRGPDGLAQTHRFATESADVPAQEGERVTMVLASPGDVGRGVGPIRFNARVPGWQPREPMTVTNHVTGQVLRLLRAPPKAGIRAAIDTSALFPIAILLASTDAASGLIDPSLPRVIALGAVAALTLGGAARTFLLPRLNQLPQRTVDAIALRQRLLAQYEQLQARLQELTEAASDEVRMLARMSQLQNKMEAVGEASYSARIGRVRKARDGLDERLAARLELMDSYAKVASMIEIEVEMDNDVLAAEAASLDASIEVQIESLMEVESLQKEWKIRSEANDEVERLLRSSPLLPDSA